MYTCFFFLFLDYHILSFFHPPIAMPLRLTTWAAQQVMKGLRHHFQSPRCPRDKKRMWTIVHITGQANKCQCLAARLEQLEGRALSSPMVSSANTFDWTDHDFEGKNFDQTDQDYVPSKAEAEHKEHADVDTQDHDWWTLCHQSSMAYFSWPASLAFVHKLESTYSNSNYAVPQLCVPYTGKTPSCNPSFSLPLQALQLHPEIHQHSMSLLWS